MGVSSPTRYAVRLLGAALAGICLWLAFPTHDLWWLAPVGVGLHALVTLEAGWWRGLGLGLVAGLGCFVPVLSWSGTYVGTLPWMALSTLQALYVALMSALVGYAGRRLLRSGHRGWALALVPPAWVVMEWARSTTPFGGFPWARLAFSQADSPLVYWAAIGGAPLVTGAVAAAGTLTLATAYRVTERNYPGAPWPLAVAAALCALPAVTTLPTQGREVTVGYVQGNVPRAGLDFNDERRAVLDNHVRGTEALAERAPADLSLVLWPENSSDIDPFGNPDAMAQITKAVAAVRVPVLVGAVIERPDGTLANASLFVEPNGQIGRYDKVHPVPFAEYIPWRDFFRVFSDKVDLVRRDFTAGTEIGAFRVPSAGGDYWALPTICFEVAYDDLMRDSVNSREGEALLVVQTNNATFGFTAESEQQLAISRIRAIEHGRAIVHVSTVGVSGFVHPDSTVTARTSLFEAAQAVGQLPVRSETTIADRIGPVPEWLALAALLLLVAAARRSGRPVRVLAPAALAQEGTRV